MKKKMKLGIVGAGKLGTLVANAWMNGLLPEYELVGVTSRTMHSAQILAEKFGCKACESIDELLELHPDYIVEAASPTVVKQIAQTCLKGGANLILLSIGALADQAFYQATADVARSCSRRVYLASGAIGGFDVLRTTALMGGATTRFTIKKTPESLRGTSVFTDELMETTKEVFAGTAEEAIALFPTRVNVAVAAALATTGPANTAVSINSIPGFVGDDHRIEVENEEVRAVVDIYSKNSNIAGWSAVALLQNIASPIVY